MIDLNREFRNKITCMEGQIKIYEKNCKEYREKIDKLEKELDIYKPKDYIRDCQGCDTQINYSELQRIDKDYNCECGVEFLCEKCSSKYFEDEKNHSGYIDVVLKRCPVCDRLKNRKNKE